MLNIFLASIPAIFFLFFFSFFEKEVVKKKWYLLIVLFLLGAIGSYLCYRLEMHFGSYFKKVKDSTYLEVLFYAIFGVAIFEEGYKWVLSATSSSIDKASPLLYSIVVSIGFALYENIFFYTIPYGFSLSRLLTAFPSHICNAIWMGIFLMKYQKTKGVKRLIPFLCSLMIPTLLHAFYNSFLYGKDPNLMKYHLYYYIGLLGITIYLWIKTKKEEA